MTQEPTFVAFGRGTCRTPLGRLGVADAAARPALFAIFAGLAMMLSPKVGELAFEVGLSTQALAQPAVGVLCRRRARRERCLGARKACGTRR